MKRTELGTEPRARCACGWKAPIAISWDHPFIALVVAHNVKAIGMVCPECYEEIPFPVLRDPVAVLSDENSVQEWAERLHQANQRGRGHFS